MSRKGTRRAYIEDSSFSSNGSSSSKGRSSAASSTDYHSFGSDGRSSAASFHSCENDSNRQASSPTEDSFIVKDNHEESTSSCDSSVQNLNSPVPPPRKQPSRFAKFDLNAPKTDPTPWPSTPTTSAKAPLFFSSQRPAIPKTPKAKNKAVFDKVTDPDELSLLMELYPELAEEEQEDEHVAEEEQNEAPEESGEDEPVAVLFASQIESPVRPPSSNDGEDSFDRYLKVLKGNNNEKKAEEEDDEDSDAAPSEKNFVVSDSESVVEVSSDTDEESEEDDEDEASDKENVPRSPPIMKKKSVADSLRAEFNSPSLKRKYDPDDHFMASLSVDYSGKRHPEASKFVKSGIGRKPMREQLTDRLFEIFKNRCFHEEIPMQRADVTWSGRLRTTAGITRNSISKGHSKIELSLKVCTTPERLRDTLIHEMCHAANWLIDRITKARHGPAWVRWTQLCRQRLPSLPHIGRCHAYNVEKKFIYMCNGCGQKVGRHSKSLNQSKVICGICRGKFVLTKNGQVVDEEAKPTNKFAQFVKEQYGNYKKEGVKHQEVMQLLSEKWKMQTDKNANEPPAVAEDDLDISVLSIHE